MARHCEHIFAIFPLPRYNGITTGISHRPAGENGKGREKRDEQAGFGFLRLPQTEEKEIDWPLLNQMVDAFLAGGGTYFDTAYTYLDWDSPALEAHKCYDIASRYGKEVVVMEPVKGGTLADPPQEARQLLEQAAPGESPASWAIRFAQSLDRVSIVLSGMNTMGQLRDNLRDLPPLTEDEWALLARVGELISGSIAIPCTACRYCEKECPQGIAIPDYFRIFNAYQRFPADGWKMTPVYAAVARDHGKASQCIHCRKCEKNCPQQIPITHWLEQVAKALE